MIVLSDVPPPIVLGYGIALGLFGGSFLNVVIYRVPRGMSIVRPASHCPSCGAPVRLYDNLPVVSYLLLRGRARCCKAKISPRYPLVEMIGAMLALAIVEVVVFRLPAATPILRAAIVFVADLMFALSLVAVAFIDLEHMYVPDAISIGGTVVGLITFSLRPDLRLADAVFGALFGFFIVWLPFGVLYRLVRGRTGMGLGDAKLLMMAGAWFGWAGATFSLLAGAVQGTLVALAMLLFRGKLEEPAGVKMERAEIEKELAALGPEERAVALAELANDPLYEAPPSGLGTMRIAFGPFLALAMLEYLLVGRDFLSTYTRWFSF